MDLLTVAPGYTSGTMNEFVYILIEREFIKCNEKVYKIGRTKDMKIRLQGYPKGTKLLLLSTVSDSQFVENQIKKTFKEKFKQRTDIGTEYFEGIYMEMLIEFNEIVKSAQLQTLTPLTPAPEPENIHFAKPIVNMVRKRGILKMHTCECGFSCKTSFNLNRHQTSRTHELNMLCGNALNADENGLYTCTICNYTTIRKNNFRQHILSSKHKNKSEASTTFKR